MQGKIITERHGNRRLLTYLRSCRKDDKNKNLFLSVLSCLRQLFIVSKTVPLSNEYFHARMFFLISCGQAVEVVLESYLLC